MVADARFDNWVTAARAGDVRAIGRVITVVEDHPERLRAVAELLPEPGHAEVIGVTGAPGVGKSTSTSALITAMRQQGKRVAVLAVDPSSPFTGGALLGDRIRMAAHATDPDVFIRSMASRGHLGGMSASTPQAVRVLDRLGFDIVLVETVGVGQSEVDVAALADTTVVLLAPGMGDGIQAAKAGILEIADVFAVNKADRDGADATVRELRHMISLAGSDPAPAVIATVASTGAGIDELLEAIAAHRLRAATSGQLERRRRLRAAAEIAGLVHARVSATIGDVDQGPLAAMVDEVIAGRLDPFDAADRLG